MQHVPPCPVERVSSALRALGSLEVVSLFFLWAVSWSSDQIAWMICRGDSIFPSVVSDSWIACIEEIKLLTNLFLWRSAMIFIDNPKSQLWYILPTSGSFKRSRCKINPSFILFHGRRTRYVTLIILLVDGVLALAQRVPTVRGPGDHPKGLSRNWPNMEASWCPSSGCLFPILNCASHSKAATLVNQTILYRLF